MRHAAAQARWFRVAPAVGPSALPFLLAAALTVCGPPATAPCTAQDPADQPRGEEPFEPGSFFKDLWQQSHQAKSEDDFSRMITAAESALRRPLSARWKDYAHRVLSWSYNRRGEVRDAAGQDAAALADFQQAVRYATAENPSRFLYLHNRGVSLARAGKLDEALRDFNAVVRLRADFAKARFNRGELFYARGQLAEAIADYTAALRLEPQARYHNSRGHAHYRRGEYQQALADYNAALEKDPELAEVYVNRADVLCELGQYRPAVEDYRQAQRLEPDSPWAHRGLAWVLAAAPENDLRDPPAALEAARRAAKLAGEDDPRILDALAAALAATGRFDEAVRVQQRVVRLAAGQPADLQRVVQGRLRLYRQQQPFRLRGEAATPPRRSQR